MPPDYDDETWRPGSEGMSLSCREDRMMMWNRFETAPERYRRHPHAT